MKPKMLHHMKINEAQKIDLQNKFNSIVPTQTELLGGSSVTRQSYDTQRFYRSINNSKKLDKRTVISLKKVKNSAKCVQNTYKIFKTQRSLSEFKPLDNLTKINMGKICQETPRRNIKNERINNNIFGDGNKTHKFYDKLSKSSKRRPKTTSDSFKDNKDLGARIKDALVKQKRAMQRNEFFVKKDINPANFCFFENAIGHLRAKTSHINSRKPERDEILKQNTNHRAVSRYLIEKPNNASKMFTYNMGKAEMNVLNMERKSQSKPILGAKPGDTHKDFLKNFKKLVTEPSLKDLRARRMIQSSRELKRSLKYQNNKDKDEKKKTPTKRKLTVRYQNSTINLVMKTYNKFEKSVNQYKELKSSIFPKNRWAD
ncbi:unnamed protein product [Moneuplotes crassus]|uniref:Uncharacterized protein n=1 Tax=Euplotes crassus TaxID=5936 RepID=A0AAD1Y3G1_EUPCR|nr:unnamed protein product [Moneuplotes crassus]